MKLKTWGVSWNQELPHSIDYTCTECNDDSLKLDRGFIERCKKHIVGFDAGNHSAIFMCPKCFCLFWFHLNQDVAERFFSDFKK